MIHILLTILKIMGILLLTVIGIVLTLLLLLLFVPIRYRLHAGINEQGVLSLMLERAPRITDEEKPDILGNLELTAAVTWLLKLLRVTVKFFNKKLTYNVKAACFKILSSEPKEKRRRRKRTQQKKKKNVPGAPDGEEPNAEKTQPDTEMVTQAAAEKPAEGETAPPPTPLPPSSESSTASLQADRTEEEPKEKKPKKPLNETLAELSDKAQNIFDMVGDEENQALVIMALKNLKKLLWHIRPRGYYCYLYYGADDPSVTGKMMMAYGIAKGVLGMEHLEITPDFERKIIKLSAQLEGRIRLIHVAVIACKIYFNKTFRKLIGGK